MSTRIFLAAVACAALSVCVEAAQLTGTVTDDTGAPVEGATVKVWGKDISTTSDASGKFIIDSPDLVDGNRYSVTVEAAGYDQGQTLSTEVFDDASFGFPLDVVLYTAQPIPEPTPDAAVTNAAGGVTNAVMTNAASTDVTIDVEDDDEPQMLLKLSDDE